jgi:hypothetical protein
MNSRVLPSFEQAFTGPIVRYDTPHKNFYGGIQIPKGTAPGVVFMHKPGKTNTPLGHYLYEDIVQASKDRVHLEGLLRHLGVTVLWNEAAADAYCEYASGESIVRAVAAVNKELPPEHRLSKFKVVPGSNLPAEGLLSNLAIESAFSLATGEGDSSSMPPIRLAPGPVPHAYYSAHDMIVHFPTMLVTEPTEVMGLVQSKAFRGYTADQTPNGNGSTAIGLTMRELDRDLTHNPKSIGYSAVNLQPHPEAFQKAFGVDLSTADRLADLTVAHIAYIEEQFPA